jgi:hypothetical protein
VITNLEFSKLSGMDIVEIRRENLRRWIEKNGTPPKERSLFSQLKADGSFGERVARRLEEQYRMGSGYLDRNPWEPQVEQEGPKQETGPSGDAGMCTAELLTLAAEMINTYYLASPDDRERIDLAFREAKNNLGVADKLKVKARAR